MNEYYGVFYHPKYNEICVRNKSTVDFHPAFDWLKAQIHAQTGIENNGWIYIGSFK